MHSNPPLTLIGLFAMIKNLPNIWIRVYLQHAPPARQGGRISGGKDHPSGEV